jgi:hypothetical protein
MNVYSLKMLQWILVAIFVFREERYVRFEVVVCILSYWQRKICRTEKKCDQYTRRQNKLGMAYTQLLLLLLL